MHQNLSEFLRWGQIPLTLVAEAISPYQIVMELGVRTPPHMMKMTKYLIQGCIYILIFENLVCLLSLIFLPIFYIKNNILIYFKIFFFLNNKVYWPICISGSANSLSPGTPSKSMYRIVRVNGKPATRTTLTTNNNKIKSSSKQTSDKNKQKSKSNSPPPLRPSPPRDYVLKKSSTPPTPPRPSPPRQSPPKFGSKKKRNSYSKDDFLLDDTPPRPPPPVLYTSTLPPPVPKKMGGKITTSPKFNSKTLPATKRTAVVPKPKPLQKSQPLQVT